MDFVNFKPQPKYSDLRKRRRRKFVHTPQLSGSKNILLGILAFIFIVLAIFGLIKFAISDYFNIEDITLMGARDESTSVELDKYYDQNILFIKSNGIENELLEQNPSFKSVRVIKYWPNKLFIIISEKQPLLYYINFTGVYIVDEDAKITKILYSDKINFNNEQLNIITGAEGIDSKLVEERLSSEFQLDQEKLPEEERVDYKYEEVSLQEKFDMLNTIREELIDQSLVILNEYSKNFDQSRLPDLKKVYVFENYEYMTGQEVDSDRVVLTGEVSRFFDQKNIVIREVIWEGKFVLRFITDTGKQYVFGTNRNTGEQFEDFEIIVSELIKENKNYSEIDFSSRKVSVK